MPVIFCHTCQRRFSVQLNEGECPNCGGGFVEEVAAPQVGRRGAFAAANAGNIGPQHSYSRSYTLPGGRGTFQVVASTSSGGPMPGGAGFGGATGVGGMPPAAQFMQSVVDAMMGEGFLQTGNPFMGVPIGIPPMGGMPGGDGVQGHAVEHEWLDQLMSRIMADYEPASQATAQHAVRSLPVLAVRAKDVQGEPGEGQAVARAGEPCSICHDEFHEGEKVRELPCRHNYHQDCVLPWLETHNTCPVCRHELPAEDPSVEARRQQRQRAEATAASGSSGRHASRAHQGPQQAPSGNRLADLVSHIASSWNSGDSATHANDPNMEPPAVGGSSSSRAAAAASRSSSAGSLGTGPLASTSARAPLAGGSSNSGGLRHRREAAAEAAERRLRGESQPALHPPVPQQPQPIQPHTTLPPRAATAPRDYAQEGGHAGHNGGGSDGVVAGVVAGGVLGVLLGGALMLLGSAAGRRSERERG